ncbi:MAG: NADH-quinone oxidoreductase subunit NuoH [Nitrososphaerales archaeon]
MGVITTFEQFLVRILQILFWLLLLIPMILTPIILLILPYFDISSLYPLVPFKERVDYNQFLKFLMDPTLVFPYLGDWMKTDFFKVVIFPGFTFAALFSGVIITWWERKFLSKVHNRYGPVYAGKFGGILQSIADLFKLLFKEIIIPERVDKLFFFMAPMGTLAISGALLALIPLGPSTYIARSNLSLLLIFAVLGFYPIVVLLASWASANKFSFIGGLRSLHQLVSYEIPLLLSVLGIVIMAGSLDLIRIVEAQVSLWFLIPQFLGAIVFIIATLAELERIPFDLPEADTEIVAGWLTEYSGMLFAIIQLAAYLKFYALSALFTVLFLGGWHGPIFLPPEAWTIIKVFLVMSFLMLIRGSMPRIRIDQLIRIGWVWLITIALINLFIALFIYSMGVKF